MIAPISCYKCGARAGHITRECPVQGDRVCFRCQQPGHFQRDCLQPRPPNFTYACWGCGSPDHLLPDCPEPRCKTCDEPGHFTSYCPNLRCHRCGRTGHYTSYCPRPPERESTPGRGPPQPDEHTNQQPQALSAADRIDSMIAQLEALFQRLDLHDDDAPPQAEDRPHRPVTPPQREPSPRRAEPPPPLRRADTASPHEMLQVVQRLAPPPDTRARAEDLARRGDLAFGNDLLYTALARYNEAIKLINQDAVLFEKRAIVLMEMKRFRDAESDLQRALALQAASPNTQTLLRLGRVNYALVFLDPAKHYASQALAQDPDSEPAHALLRKISSLHEAVNEYHISAARRNWRRANDSYVKCVELLADTGAAIPVEWICWSIDCQVVLSMWQTALSTAESKLILYPDSADLTYRKGFLLFFKADIPEAKQVLHKALRLDPDHAPAKALRARVRLVDSLKTEGKEFYSAEKWDKALEAYTKCLKVIGSDIAECNGGFLRAILLSNRAATYMKLGKIQDARADVQASLSLNPSLVRALRIRGRLSMLGEDYESAVKDLQQAFELSVPGQVPRGLEEELARAKAVLEGAKGDYYSLLDVLPTCTAAELSRAYRRLSLQHHPDRGGDEEKFKAISGAYSVLSNEEERRRYDLRRSRRA